jgi:nucleoside 2-deoxyribosyltransferase
MIPNRHKFYLAAPLFTMSERRWNVELADMISNFGDVYVPQSDGDLLVDLVDRGMPVEEAKMLIFSNDVRAIEECTALIIVMDGRVIDEGACFELGYAFARGKLCFGIKTDCRSLLPIGDNPMIDCALHRKFTSIEALQYFLNFEMGRKL